MVELLKKLFAQYTSAGGKRSMTEFFDPFTGLVVLVIDEKGPRIWKWDARLTDKMGIKRPSDDEIASLVKTAVEAAGSQPPASEAL
jgi:hypothetical protein